MASHRSSLSLFRPVSPSQLYDIVLSMKPSFCHSDVLPSQIFKEAFPALSQVFTAIINSSLTNGIVPASFKHAIVQPLLKKHHLDQHDLNNYRPMSKLSFISKVLEKVVYSQILSYLSTFNIFDTFQSGFREFHSTEYALLKVTNDILLDVS